MICNSCKNEFENIDGLKFCPYCGTKLEEEIDLKSEEDQEEQDTEEKKDTIAEDANTQKIHDTLEMPVITKEQVRKYKMDKFFKVLKKTFKKSKMIITAATFLLLVVMGGFGYSFLIGRPVDEGRIKEDIINKIVLLPKGTSFEIKKDCIKSFSIKERITQKREKDDIKAEVTLNNGTIEVNTLLSLQYVYAGNNTWKISHRVELTGGTTVKPLIGMDESKILSEVKKANITIGNTTKALSDEDVKKISIVSRTPDFENSKEEVLVEAGFDSGFMAASGKIKVSLNFKDEAWSVASIERNSAEDFTLALSPAFSDKKILETVKKDVLNQTVTHPDVFGGKSFYINDSFTKSMTIENKSFDAQNQKLNVTIKRQNTAGELKAALSTDYIFELSLNKLEALKKSKTTAQSVSINDISKDTVISSIAGAEIEGNNLFFWYYDNHKITAEEAKTFRTDKVASKKGFENVKYVFGNITYKEGNKQKTTNVIAAYHLVYDSSKGYYWKLDRIVGEGSPNYKTYTSQVQ